MPSLSIHQKPPSQARIQCAVERVLAACHRYSIGLVKVEVSGREVTLTGSLSTMSERIAAQLAVWSAPDVGCVINCITVPRPGESGRDSSPVSCWPLSMIGFLRQHAAPPRNRFHRG